MKLQANSSNALIPEFAADSGVQQIDWIADFLAPVVPSRRTVGRFHKSTLKAPWLDFDCERPLHGRASIVELHRNTEQFKLQPFAVDVPVDAALGDDVDLATRDAENIVRTVMAAKREKLAIQAALAATEAGAVPAVWDGSADPIKRVDEQILAVIKSSRCNWPRVLFGATAFHIFKHHANVKGRLNGGAAWITNPGLFHGNAPFRAAYSLVDVNPLGLDPEMAFQLDSAVLVFVTNPLPSRFDPSFMKTFRLVPKTVEDVKKFGVRVHTREDGRVEFTAADWAEEVVVTNELGAVRLNISES